jgi:S-formylglutathione hydrolase FrmB
MYPRQFKDTSQSVRQGLRSTIERAFGTSYSEHSLNNDVFEVYKRQPADSLPFFYLATGIQDGFKAFLGLHRMLTDSLRANNIRYEYHETVGGHDWKYWDREVRKMLPRMMEVLGS